MININKSVSIFDPIFSFRCTYTVYIKYIEQFNQYIYKKLLYISSDATEQHSAKDILAQHFAK